MTQHEAARLREAARTERSRNAALRAEVAQLSVAVSRSPSPARGAGGKGGKGAVPPGVAAALTPRSGDFAGGDLQASMMSLLNQQLDALSKREAPSMLS